MSILGFEFSAPFLVLGLILGMTYGLLAVGLVIVYRVNKIINFAHGATGVLAAAVLGALVVQAGVPYWIAFAIAIPVSALAGALAEVAVVRRLREAPRIMSLVATLGMALFFESMGQSIFGQISASNVFPQPTGLPSFFVGALRVTPAHTAMLIFSPLLVVGFALVLARTRFGMALRGAAANRDRARMVGIHAGRMSSAAWAIAGAFSGFTAILVFPTRGFSGGGSFGPSLLLRALAAAVIGRMTSLPRALAAGVCLGVIEQQIIANQLGSGIPSLVIFVVVLVGLFWQERDETRTRERGAWAAVASPRTLVLPTHVRRVIDEARPITIAAFVIITLALSQVLSNAASLTLSSVLALTTVALSVGITAGLGGHLSLAQFAFAGVGAAASVAVANATGNYVLALVAAGAAGAVVAIIVGLPALRIRGIMYAVATLAFALAAQDWVLQQPWALGGDQDFDRPAVGPFDFDTGRAYLYWSVIVLAIGFFVVLRTRTGALGRSYVALRDNEDAARSFGVPAVRRTVELFGLGGLVAGLGGAVFAHGVSGVQASDFSTALSINVVAAGVLGGLGFSAGPILGAMYIFALPIFLPLDSAALAGTALGWLLLVLYFPGGLGSIVQDVRDAVVRRFFDVEAAHELDSGDVESLSSHEVQLRERETERADGMPDVLPGDILLQAFDLARHYGGVRAVDGVTMQVHRGEILGLMGPNGAGKTTLFELLSGFNTPDRGKVVYAGVDISAMTPEKRMRLGLVRSFQDAAMFPTMSVLEALTLAQERLVPTNFVEGLLSGGATERVRKQRAREVVDLMGLGPYAGKRISELSTGTRRIAELGCMVSLTPRLLLLDEPSSGIAQRESEALGTVLRQVRDYLDCTMVVIEHDVPLMLGLVDRITAMESGQILLTGNPRTVVADERVVASYLGGDSLAIERSEHPRPELVTT